MRGLFCLDYDDPNVPQEVLVIEHVGVREGARRAEGEASGRPARRV